MESRFNSKSQPNFEQPILVVGGGGYIGSHVVEQLLLRDYRVRILDKFVFGKHVIADLLPNKNLEIIRADMSDLYNLTLSLKDTQAVVHLAGLVGDPACAVDEEMTLHVNIAATKIIKEIAKAFGVSRFIFASSCSVYGASDQVMNEKSVLNPVSLYAKTKIDAEQELLVDESVDFHPTILRFATVFGHSRRPRFDLVANMFAAQAYHDGVITVTGSDQWRPFVHTADIARAIVQVLESPLPLVNREIFNVGDDRFNITIGDLAKLTSQIVRKDKSGKPVRVEIKDDVTDRRNYIVSFKKIRKNLGFEANMDLERGIKEIADNLRRGAYKQHYKNKVYINVEMTKLLQKEFHTDEYKKNNISLVSKVNLVPR